MSLITVCVSSLALRHDCKQSEVGAGFDSSAVLNAKLCRLGFPLSIVAVWLHAPLTSRLSDSDSDVVSPPFKEISEFTLSVEICFLVGLFLPGMTECKCERLNR